MSIREKLIDDVSKILSNGVLFGSLAARMVLAGFVLYQGFGAILTLTSQESALAQELENYIQQQAVPLLTIEQNSLLPVTTSLLNEELITQKMQVVATAYSSSVWETDDTPHITAWGTNVRDGVVANNLLPLGKKIRLPELFGNKIFTVEDRMHWRKGYYHVDIWFPSYQEALAFGVKTTSLEVLPD